MATSSSEVTDDIDPFEKDLEKSVRNVAIQMGCWSTGDDYLLINSVVHLGELELVHERVKFSMKFSLENIRDRWKCLLYHAPISKMIVKKLEQLSMFEIEHLKIPLNEEEENLIKTIRSDTNPALLDDEIDRILSDNFKVFWPNRKISELRTAWTNFQQNSELNDQIEAELQPTLSEREKTHFHALSDVLAPFEFELHSRNNENFKEKTEIPSALIYTKEKIYPIYDEKVTFGTENPQKTFEITIDSSCSISGQGFFYRQSNDFFVVNDGPTGFRVNGVFLEPNEFCFIEKRAIIQLFESVMAFHQIVSG